MLSVGNHSYVYDGLGNRVQQTVSSVVTDYLNDVQPGLTKLLKQDDGTNVDRFVHGVRDIHAVDDGTDWNFYANDGLGSVRALLDDADVIQSSMSYDPYGMPLGTLPDNFGFTGEQTDANGQVFLRARYYEPSLGIFSALDPWEGISNRPMSLNGYSWVEGNVINATDPTGMVFWAFPASGGPGRNSRNNPTAYIRYANHYAHAWIEKWMERQNGYWKTHAEFRGGGARLDAFTLEYTNQFDPSVPSPIFFRPDQHPRGSIFEIEPLNIRAIISGYIQVSAYLTALRSPLSRVFFPRLAGNIRATDSWDRSPIPEAGKRYDLTPVDWQLGTRLSSSLAQGPYLVSPALVDASASGVPTRYWIGLVAPGLIVYETEQNMRALAAVTAVAVAREMSKMYDRARNSRGGALLPNPIPAFSALAPSSIPNNPDFEICSVFNGGLCWLSQRMLEGAMTIGGAYAVSRVLGGLGGGGELLTPVAQ